MAGIVRIFTNFTSIEGDFRHQFPGSTLEREQYEVIVNQSGLADMAIVLGVARPHDWVEGCTRGIYKVLQDPPR